MAGYEDFIDLGYKPDSHDVIASFRVKVPKWSTPKRAWGAVAAESSVGTWSPMKSLNYKNVKAVAAKVFEAKGEWIFYIDADERVPEELKKELINFSRQLSDKFTWYATPRLNVILGRPMKHGGWWPDYVKRLYKKSALKKWKGDLHEEPEVIGEMGKLKSPLRHEKHEDLHEMLEKTNKWSEIEAKLMYDAGHPKMNVLRFITAMGREFWYRMIRKMAFLDGKEGIIYAIYQVYSRLISYAKLWEKQQ